MKRATGIAEGNLLYHALGSDDTFHDKDAAADHAEKAVI
jgi:hypothetical protein